MTLDVSDTPSTVGMKLAGRIAHTGLLNLDHVGAEIAQQAAHQRSCQDGRCIEDTQPAQPAAGHQHSSDPPHRVAIDCSAASTSELMTVATSVSWSK